MGDIVCLNNFGLPQELRAVHFDNLERYKIAQLLKDLFSSDERVKGAALDRAKELSGGKETLLCCLAGQFFIRQEESFQNIRKLIGEIAAEEIKMLENLVESLKDSKEKKLDNKGYENTEDFNFILSALNERAVTAAVLIIEHPQKRAYLMQIALWDVLDRLNDSFPESKVALGLSRYQCYLNNR